MGALRRVPKWVWAVEVLGLALVILAGLGNDFTQAALLEIGAALLLALPLSLLEQGLEGRLTRTIERTVAESVAAAEQFQLSGPRVPTVPEELELWPFHAVVVPQDHEQVELQLVSLSANEQSAQPVDVTLVVTDPTGQTFTVDRRLNSLIRRNVASWVWPHQFTSDDRPKGQHKADWFLAPVSVGPSRRFGQVATVTFEYPTRERST